MTATSVPVSGVVASGSCEILILGIGPYRAQSRSLPRRAPRVRYQMSRTATSKTRHLFKTLKNIVARRTATAARRQEIAIVHAVTQTIVAAANDIALCANS